MPDTQHKFEWWNPFSWVDWETNKIVGWLGGLGGDIASGLESGQLALLTDLGKWVLPFLEIMAGVLIAMWTILIWLASTQGGETLLRAAAAGIAK